MEVKGLIKYMTQDKKKKSNVNFKDQERFFNLLHIFFSVISYPFTHIYFTKLIRRRALQGSWTQKPFCVLFLPLQEIGFIQPPGPSSSANGQIQAVGN